MTSPSTPSWNGWYDINGNYYTDDSSNHTGSVNSIHYNGSGLVPNVTAGTAITCGSGGGAGGATNLGYPYSISFPNGGILSTANTIHWNVAPTFDILNNPEIADALITKMVTLYKPEDPLIICVDDGWTTQQLREMSEVLKERGIQATIISGARAGTGPVIYRPVKEKHQRIDILARLAEVWERKPELNLAELLAWWDGQNMNDDDFAAATEVHFNKIYEDYGY